jgi:hypothetical protein
MGILAPISVIDSANINKMGPLLATEWIGSRQQQCRSTNPIRIKELPEAALKQHPTHTGSCVVCV